jgi:hypothetical protein
MARTADRGMPREGMEVYDSDGDKVGKIFSIYPNYIVIEKGFFFPTDYFIPIDAIASYDGDKAYLNVTKDEAVNRSWDIEPGKTDNSGTERFDATGTATYAAARKNAPADVSAPAAADAAAGAAAAAGLTDHMGESDTSPGLAGDLSDDHPTNSV